MSKTYTVITGGSSGIGKAIATGFAKKGHNLILVARKVDELENTKQELLKINKDIDVVIKSCDLTDLNAIVALYENLAKAYDLKTWVNDAGMAILGYGVKDDIHRLDQMIKLNVTAYAVFTRLFVADHLNDKDATLFNVDSASGYCIFTPLLSYSATKYYVAAMTEGYSHEIKTLNGSIRLKMLCPSMVQTNIMKNAGLENNYKQAGLVNTMDEIENYAMQLYDSDKLVGYIDPRNLHFELKDALYPYFDIDANKAK